MAVGRPGQQELCAWVGDAKVAAVEAGARRYGFVNASGEVNKSAMLRRIIDEWIERQKEPSA